MTAWNQQRALDDYSELQRRVSVGAYEERSAYHYESGTWPEDGVEESLFNLEELAAKDELEFLFDVMNDTWILVPMSEETKTARREAQEYMDTEHYMKYHYLGGE